MKKLFGWVVLLVAAFCAFQYGKAVVVALGFNDYLQHSAEQLVSMNPERVEEEILQRADDVGIYLDPDDLQVLARPGGTGSVYARFIVPVGIPMVEWNLERTFSTGE
jgi:hypothetical protein